MLQLALSGILFITVLIIGIILLKNIFKIIALIVSAALVFLIVAGALIFLDLQSFTQNFYTHDNQLLLKDSNEDKIISTLVLRFENGSKEGELVLQSDEMIKRADGFYEKNALAKQKGYYKHIIFESKLFPNKYEFDTLKISKKEILDIIKSTDSVVALRDMLKEKVGEDNANVIMSGILSEIKNPNLLKSFLFKVMLSKIPSELSINFFLNAIKAGNIIVVPETPIFTLMHYLPDFVNFVLSKIQNHQLPLEKLVGS